MCVKEDLAQYLQLGTESLGGSSGGNRGKNSTVRAVVRAAVIIVGKIAL